MADIGYIRVSTVQQNTDRQLADVKLDRTFEEKVSGKNMDRPELTAMIDYVRDGDLVHVHELSRLGRNTKDLLSIIDAIKAKGARVKFHKEGITAGGESDAVGNLMLTVLAGVAQMEREMMLERQAEGMRAAKAKGEQKVRGHGKRIDRDAIRKALAKGDSIRKIANDLGVSTYTVQQIKKGT